MLSPDQTPRASSEIFDAEAAAQELDALGRQYSGRESELRSAVAQYLKGELNRGRDKAEQMLLKDRHGRRCAERLCVMQDEIIHVLFEFIGKRLYPSLNPSEAERMAVVATGGYGRGLLAPGSDIDLLFLLPYKQTAWGESVAEAILYCLWDMGLKVGHATRSVDECIRQAKADMTIRTAILESRFLNGDRALFDELVERFDRNVAQGTGPEFVAAKLAEREDRLRRAGQSRYLVEPNVKDGKGGLRDLHTLFWIGKYVYRVRNVEELVDHGVFDQDELKIFRRCEDFLWSVRCHMHFVTGRPEERLSFDIQREIAVRLGYTAHPGLRDVERFMKHYFLTAKNVGDLTAILCAALEANHTKSAPMLGRVMARFRSSGRRSLSESDDFIVDNNRINIVKPDVFERDPVNLIRIFYLAQKHNLAFHPDAMRTATRSLKLIDKDLRENAEANRLFLRNPHVAERCRDRAAADERGRRARRVRARLRPRRRDDAVQHVSSLHGRRTSDPLHGRDLGDRIRHQRRIRARQRTGAASCRRVSARCFASRCSCTTSPRAGSRIIRSPARASRADSVRGSASRAAETETVAWLIENHLVMSTVAQSRDLSDRKTIENFAGVVQSLDRLKLLLVLTTADIRAVGPGVWNGWKAQLLRTLYYETEPVLTGGFSEVNRERRVAIAQAEFREWMKDWPESDLDAYIARHYPAYWLKVDLAHKIAQARFLRDAWSTGRTLATQFSFDAMRGVTELTVIAPDHPRLLSIIAGACAAAGANIVDAQIFTTTDGLALDTIAVTREFEHDEDEARRAGRIADTIEKALRGEIKLPDIVARKAVSKSRLKAFALEPEVNINNEWSNRYTVVEVTGLDRPGLLYELTSTISRLSLNIASAHVATFGERVVDVFYVTDLLGAKIASPTRQAAIKRALLALFARPAADEAKQAAKARA